MVQGKDGFSNSARVYMPRSREIFYKYISVYIYTSFLLLHCLNGEWNFVFGIREDIMICSSIHGMGQIVCQDRILLKNKVVLLKI